MSLQPVANDKAPGLSPKQIDQLIDEHFMFEATDNIEGVLSTLTDDAEHYVIPSPMGVLNERAKIREFYQMLYGDLRGEGVTPVRRLYGEDFVVDEVFWSGYISNGRPFFCDGKSGPVSFQILGR